MSDKQAFPRFLYVLIVLGLLFPIIIGLLLFVLAGPLMKAKDLRMMQEAPANLGELGERCGGPSRWPCKPGLVCSVPYGGAIEKIGECVPDTRTVYPPGKQGEVCDMDRGCEPGLLCDHLGGVPGVCMSVPTSTQP